jgi:Skp family chaperone for outer membrane proteins
MRRMIAIIIVMSLSLLFMPPSPSHAGIIDRIKAIYNTPEKVDDLLTDYEEQYEQTKQQFEDTQKALEQQQQELQAINEQYRSDNEKLQTQNIELMQRLALMEKQQSDRKSLIRKLLIMMITVIGLILGYYALIRIWRYLVWRKQHANHQGRKL